MTLVLQMKHRRLEPPAATGSFSHQNDESEAKNHTLRVCSASFEGRL